MGWVYHGPLGNGAAFIDRVQGAAQRAIAETDLPGIVARLGRDPMSRTATLSGPADQFQREGQGELKGLNDIVRATEGVSDVQWADEGDPATGTPLNLDAVLARVVAYTIGLGLGPTFFGRDRQSVVEGKGGAE